MPFRLILEPPPSLMRGLAEAPQIVREQLQRGMATATLVSAQAVRQEIEGRTEIHKGNLVSGVRRRVTEEGGGRIVGRIGVGAQGRSKAWYGQVVNNGAVIRPRNAAMLAIPLTPAAERQRLEWRKEGIRSLKDVADLQLIRGKNNALIISRTQGDVRFLLKRGVTVRGRHFLEAGMQNAAGQAQEALATAYRRALRRISKGGAG
jgi:hypothetical protein